MTAGPLEGTTVLEFGQALAGPYAATVLADLGASVIKVEPPAGEMFRHNGPFHDGVSLYFLAANRNKRCVAVDLKMRESSGLVARLVESADVVIENFRPQVAERLGIAYEQLSRINPRIVYLSISGYGSEGPMSHWGGFDQVAQGVSGLMSVTGRSEPTRAGIPVADVLAAVYGALGVVAALARRARTGLGEKVETSLLASVVSSLGVLGQQYLCTGAEPELIGNEHAVLYPYGVFETSDGELNVAVAGDALWVRFCTAIGAPDLAVDPAFATNQQRVAARGVLRLRLNDVMRTRSRGDWTRLLNEAGIPAGPIDRLSDVFTNEQVLVQNLVTSLPGGAGGPVPSLGSPLRFSLGSDPARCAAAPVGAHTREVLAEIGMSVGEIDDLVRRGVVGAHDAARI